jgi:parvulin-like peptidyl-prolyl isomerase
MKKVLALLLITVFSVTFLITACSQPEVTEVEAAHILLMYSGSERAPATITRSKEEAKQEIEDLLKQVKSGTDFGELAKQHSDCPSKAKGGNLGSFNKGAMVPAFEDAAFSLKKGKISDVVETPFGFHIIKRIS